MTVSAPDALAITIRLRVDNAAAFMLHRLSRVVERAAAHEDRYDGLLIELSDARGLAWADGETRFGGDDYTRPSLMGCNPFPLPGELGPIPPCPAK